LEAHSGQRSFAAENRRTVRFRSPGSPLCTADAVEVTTAHEVGESEVWTSDRHMLAAATYFGLTVRFV